MMALLAEALRSSAIQTAEFRAQDGAAVIVQRATGTAEPDSEEQYAVRLRRADQPAEDRFAAENLLDRKSTRLNSSHTVISYAVFCLKKKKKKPAKCNRRVQPNHL